jgi:hypothetical protein
VLDFSTLQRLRRFARFWDLIGNSGNFVETTPLIWSNGNSPFWSFWNLTDWLYAELHRTHEIALPQLMQLLMRWLQENRGLGAEQVAKSLLADWRRGGRSEIPEFLRSFADETAAPARTIDPGLKRQRRRSQIAA